MSLEKAVSERVSFLREQIDPSNREIVNETFQLQIDVLQSADRGKSGAADSAEAQAAGECPYCP